MSSAAPSRQSVFRVLRSRGLMISTVLLLGLLVLGWLGLPPLARWGIEKYGSEALGRAVKVESVSFNPLLLDVRIEGLKIAEADGVGEFLDFAALQLDLSSASLWHRALVLDAVRVETPRINLVRLDSQRFNFSDILERFSKPDQSGADTGASFFSLNNIEVTSGDIRFDDRLVNEKHQIDKLALSLPFISNLPTRVTSFVQPRLAFDLNGSSFELKGEVKPFAEQRIATLNLDVEDFDLTRYLSYLPGKLPVRVEQARLSSALSLRWEESVASKPASLALSGRLALADLKVKDGTGAELLQLPRFQMDIAKIEPLASPALIHVSDIKIDALKLDLLREKDQRFRLQRLFQEYGGEKGRPAAGKKAQTSAGVMPRVILDKFSLAKARVHWRDEVPPGGFALALEPFEVQLAGFDLTGKAPAKLTVNIAGPDNLKLQLQAAVALAAETYNGQFKLSGVQLEALRPYYKAALPQALFRGETAASGEFRVLPGKAGIEVQLDKMMFDLKRFALADARGKPGKLVELVKVPETQIEGVRVDMAQRVLHVDRFSNRGMQAFLLRDASGGLNLVELFQSQSSSDAQAKEVLKDKLERAAEVVLEAAPAEDADQPWQMSVGKVDLVGGGLKLEDRSSSVAVVLDVHDMALNLKDWSTLRNAQSQAVLSARVNRTGSVKAESRFSTEPLRGSVNLDLRSLDLLPVQPYLDDVFRVLLTRGNATVNGKLDFDLPRNAKPDLRFTGAVSVDDLNVLDRVNDEDFLRWKHFSIQDMKARLEPMAFSSKEIRLKDFYTRLILDAKGRLNIREITAQDAALDAPAATESVPAKALKSEDPSKPAITLNLERIVLENGHVRFSDRFVKPNYDANLLSLSGTLGGLSSDEDSVAALDLTASLDGAAPVKVYGSLNPLRQDGFLDIQAQVRDVDLTSASTYAARYVGYGIDRGKLSMDVQYEIRNRKLNATNSVRLDQLSFGNKVDSPDATSLPVLLAVALLKDRRGMIDIRLPISGSLDDPKFSVGSVILKVLGNLISKAITSPFALLGSIFGDGGEELAYIDFQPGSARIPEKGSQKLADLVRAMGERPELRLEITGRFEPAGDTTGLKRERLTARLRSLKAEAMAKRGESVAEVDRLEISAAEYPVLLAAVYENENLDTRPRNALGMLKRQSVAEMEKILLASYSVSEADLEALAVRRAQTVRANLLEQGKLDASRVFMRGTPGSTSTSDEKPASARVDFSLR